MKNLNVNELDVQELREINGGIMDTALLALGGAAVAWVWERGETLGRTLAKL